MAAAETARLIASLEMRDAGFTRGIDKASSGIDRIHRRLGAVSGFVNRNLGRALDAGFARALSFTTRAITTGLEDLATLESAVMSVDGAIKQAGLTGRVSGQQIAQWADEIETSVQAAFDDKAITGATANLIRFGRVTPQNLRQAMTVMTDLAAKTGDVESASTALGRALADPEKASARLARQNIFLTKAQQKAIDAAMKAGKVGEAQAIILDAVAAKTRGAAAASQGPYRDAINLLTESFEKGRMALAEGFMPLIQEFAGEATEFFGKKSTIDGIRNFGQKLADGARAALDFAKKIPWDKVGDGLSKAADFAGQLFNAFASAPPEIQAMIIGLAGLEKLSGGMLSGFVGELGKLIGGGLKSIFAAHVTVVGKSVTGGVPVPGQTPTTTTTTSGGKVQQSSLGKALEFASKLALVGIVAEFAKSIDEAMADWLPKAGDGLIKGFKVDELQWPFGPKNTPSILPELFGGNGLLGGTPQGAGTHGRGTIERGGRTTSGSWEKQHGPKWIANREKESLRAFRDGERATREGTRSTKGAIKGVDDKQRQSIAAFRSGERTSQTGLANTTRASQVAGATAAMASTSGASRVVGAIERKDMTPDVFVTTTVNVTPASIQKSTTTQSSFGRATGSSGGGRNERRPE